MADNGSAVEPHSHGRPADRGADAGGAEPRFTTARRVALAGATALIAVNIWTGAPILALWVGSRVVRER
jgi:hypothetical protein